MTHNQDTFENKPVQTIRKYWPVFVFIFILGGVYYNFDNISKTNAKNTQDNSDKIEIISQKQQNDERVQADANTQILIQLSQIQSDLKWLKANSK